MFGSVDLTNCVLHSHRIAGFCFDSKTGQQETARSCKFRKTPRDCPPEEVENYPEISVEDYYKVVTRYDDHQLTVMSSGSLW